jgi:protease-4
VIEGKTVRSEVPSMHRERSATKARGLRRWLSGLTALATLAAASATHADTIPTKASDAIPSPGRSIASGDDATAIAVNPANVALMPDPEIRWTWAWTDSGSPLPARGHTLGFGLPLWILGTGLRFDWIDPPGAARTTYTDSSRWVRWALAVRAGESASFGTTFGWSSSDAASLDSAFSVTSALTLRPTSYLSLAAVARDWNRPTARDGTRIERSYEAGLAFRPIGGRRVLEIGLEGAYYSGLNVIAPRATLGLDIPRVGRLRGDFTLLDASGGRFIATAGLDVNVGLLEVAGGGLFGTALTKSGTGFYTSAAIRGFREPGLELVPRVARIRLESTPGVRRHTRLLKRLWRLADDPETEGVLLVLRAEPASSLAHAEELGDAIRLLRARGKKVICHLEDAGGRSLYACSQADRIAMNPAGGLRFAGLSTQFYYLGGLLKKLGVRADFVRIGPHKSAAEQFTREGSTDVARADHQETLGEVERVFLSDVGGGRNIPVDELKRRIEKGPFIASEARHAGLVDVLAYEDEIGRVVEDVLGHRARIVDDDPPTPAPVRWGDPSKIAVIYLSGDMVDGESQNIPFVGIRLAGSRTIAGALKRAREDSSIKAVVFRIETGGGSSLAADVILREAILLAKKKPLIVSMGSAAASGGYYASVAAKEIFANRSTITGSIGIFYGKVDVSGLLDKFGVHIETMRTTPRADAESLFRSFTDDERAELGVKVKQFYDLFVARVSEGRNMTADAVDAIGRGKVWTGAQASQRGLVDKTGGLRQAIAEARALGHVALDSPIVEMPDDDESLLAQLLALAGVRAALGNSPVGAATPIVPPAMLQIARSLAPFLVFESTRPLARIELATDLPIGDTRAIEETE